MAEDMHRATIYAENLTALLDAEDQTAFQIVAAFGLYLVPEDEGETVDCIAFGLQNAFIHEPGTPESVIEAARDELDGGGVESVSYLMRRDVTGADSRFVARVEAPIEPDDDGIGMEAVWREIEAGGCIDDWPEILEPGTFWAWQAEKTAARRALNVPPIANYGANGLDNLPLFVAAANKLLAESLPAAERLAAIKGDCAASKAQKARLYAAGLTWPLPPAEAFRAAR